MALALPGKVQAFFRAWNHAVPEVEALLAPGSTFRFADGVEIAHSEPGVFREALQSRWDSGLRYTIAVDEVFISGRGNACFVLAENALPLRPPREGDEAEATEESPIIRSPNIFELEFDPDGAVVSVSQFVPSQFLEETAELAASVMRYFDCWNQRDAEAIQKLHAAESHVYLTDEVQYGPSLEEVAKAWEHVWTDAEASATQPEVFVSRSASQRALVLRSDKGPRKSCEVLEFDGSGLCSCYIFADSERTLHRLTTAMQYGPLQEVLQLVRHGARLLVELELEVDGQWFPGGTWLDLAVQLRRYKLCKQLLFLAVPVTQKAAEPVPYEPCFLGDWADEVALELAAEEPAALDLLGQKVEKMAQKSRFALAWAAMNGQAELMEQLLSLGVSLTAEDPAGRTPLLAAAVAGRRKCLSSLLRAGAWEVEPQQPQVEQWLQHWKLDRDSLMSDEEKATSPEPPTEAPTEAPAPDGNAEFEAKQLALAKLRTAIAHRGAAEVWRQLTEDGVKAYFDLDPLGAETGNVVDLLLLHRRYRIAAQLLNSEHGQDLATHCRKAVVWAARDGQAELLEALLQRGASAEQSDSNGRSALLLAATRGHRRCTAALAAAEPEEVAVDKVREWIRFWKMDVEVRTPAVDE